MPAGKRKRLNTACAKRLLVRVFCFISIALHTNAASAAEPFALLETDNIPLSPVDEPGTKGFQMLSSDVQSGRDLVFKNGETAGQLEITNNVADKTTFLDQSSGGEATIINNSGGETRFSDQSAASNAFITVNTEAKLSFDQQSSAADSRITNNEAGLVTFSDEASAGDSVITNNGTVNFNGSSSAENSLITNNSSGDMTFRDNADAGRRNITNNGQIDFYDQSSAGQSLIVNNESGNINFYGSSTTNSSDLNNSGSLVLSDHSSASQSSIVNNETGTIRLDGSATAGSANINNSGTIAFSDESSAGSARLFNNEKSSISFDNNSNAGSSFIINAGDLEFLGTSSAGSSSILISGGGTARFIGQSAGGTSDIHIDQNGSLDASRLDNQQLSIGSLVSAGNVNLGRTTLTADQKIVLNDTSHISLVLGYGRLIAEDLELQGGTLDLKRADDFLYEINKTYGIFYAPTYSGSAFSEVLSHDFVFVTPSVDSNTVILTRNDIRFKSVSNTPNQTAVAGALDYLNPDNLVYRSIISGSENDARRSFDLLSGEVHSSITTALSDSSLSFRDEIFNRALNGFSGTETRSEHPQFWLSARGLNAKTNGSEAIAGTKSNGYGINAGIAYDFTDHLSAGIVGDYQDTSLKISDRASSADINTWGAGLFLQWQQNGFNVAGGAAYQYHSIQTQRSLNLNALTGTLSADYNAYTTQYFTKAGYTFDAGIMDVQPYLALSHSRTEIDGFQESGLLDAALSGQSLSITSTSGTLGIQSNASYSLSQRYSLNARLNAAWNKEWGDRNTRRELSFAPEYPFYVVGASSNDEYLLMRLQIGLVNLERLSMNLTYTGVFGNQTDSTTYAANAAFKF